MNDQLELLMVIINLVSGALWKDKSVKIHHKNVQVLASEVYPVDTGRKLNVHKTFGGRPGRLLKVLCTFNLRPVSTGFEIKRLLSTFYCTDYPIFFLSCGLPFTHNFTKSSTRKCAT